MHTHSFYRAHDNSVDMNRTWHREAIEHHRYRQITDIDHEPRHFPPESDYVGIEKTCDYKGEIDNNKSAMVSIKERYLPYLPFYSQSYQTKRVRHRLPSGYRKPHTFNFLSGREGESASCRFSYKHHPNPYAGICRQSGILNILIDEANLLLKGFQVFFKMVNLALHVTQQGIAALRGNVKEAQIIFISLNFCAFCSRARTSRSRSRPRRLPSPRISRIFPAKASIRARFSRMSKCS